MENIPNKSYSHKSLFTQTIINLDEFKKALKNKTNKINHGLCGSFNLGNT